jgi:hypothetical protein
LAIPDPWRRTVDASLALIDDIDLPVAQLMRAELALGAMPVIPGGNTNVPTMTFPERRGRHPRQGHGGARHVPDGPAAPACAGRPVASAGRYLAATS